jgi:hypothetical protein
MPFSPNEIAPNTKNVRMILWSERFSSERACSECEISPKEEKCLCILGWVDFRLFCIFNKNQAYVCFFPCQSSKNSFKTCLGPPASSTEIMTCEIIHYIRAQPFFFKIRCLCVSKKSAFYVDFTNINLPLWQNAPKKSYFTITEFIVTKLSLHFWNLRTILRFRHP